MITEGGEHFAFFLTTVFRCMARLINYDITIAIMIRAGYREKFQNRYTYVQEFMVTEKYRYFLLSLLMGSVYCRFLNFPDLGTSDVLFLYASSTVKCDTHAAERDKNTQFDTRNCFIVLDTCSQQIYNNFR